MCLLVFFFEFKKNFYWTVVDLQRCVGFRLQQNESAVSIHTSMLFLDSFPMKAITEAIRHLKESSTELLHIIFV